MLVMYETDLDYRAKSKPCFWRKPSEEVTDSYNWEMYGDGFQSRQQVCYKKIWWNLLSLDYSNTGNNIENIIHGVRNI